MGMLLVACPRGKQNPFSQMKTNGMGVYAAIANETSMHRGSRNLFALRWDTQTFQFDSLTQIADQLTSTTTNVSIPPTCHMNFSPLDSPGPSSKKDVPPSCFTLLLVGRLLV
jgi:hypothetical protein